MCIRHAANPICLVLCTCVHVCVCTYVGPYFTAVELADVARQLDDEERMRMAEGGLASAEYQRFLEVRYTHLQVIVCTTAIWTFCVLIYSVYRYSPTQLIWTLTLYRKAL